MSRMPDTVSTATFADWCSVSSRTVQTWVRQGMPHRVRAHGGAEVVPREAIRWVRERDAEVLREKLVASGENESTRSRKLRLEADLKQLDLDERRRALIPAAESVAFAERFVGGFAAVATGQLARFERTIRKAETPTEAREVTRAIRNALMRGAREFADTLERDGDAGDEGAA